MATLKISDLSVGDWVQDKNGIYAKVIGVENWSNGYFLNIELHGVNVGVTPLASVYPIPITAEILEANGFAPDEYSNKIWSFIAERELIQYFFVNHKLCIRNHRNAVDVDVLHIHQLQHALRLAGLDKEIVMPNK